MLSVILCNFVGRDNGRGLVGRGRTVAIVRVGLDALGREAAMRYGQKLRRVMYSNNVSKSLLK